MRQLVLCLFVWGLSACAVQPDWDLQDPQIAQNKGSISADHAYYRTDKVDDYFTNN